MNDIAVSVDGIGKLYRLGHTQEPYARLTETLWNVMRHPFTGSSPAEDFWALREVSFEVQRGDVVGIIGRNGAGKSTLLKILSRITEPTEGQAILRGRVSSLLEVGTGFHPELTGRENVYLSGSILGMRRTDIRRRFDEIVAFAEVERFLDTPVKHYSSGMQVRLGFAVAAHLEPEILIVDEVLAVGDAAFQKKCLAKMEDVAHGGRTVLFVSHNMAAVQSLCTSGVLLEGGSVVERGDAATVVAAYLARVGRGRVDNVVDRRDRKGDGRLRVVGVSSDMRTGHESSIDIDFVAEPGLTNVQVSLGMFTTGQVGVLYLANGMTGDELGPIPERGRLTCRIPHCSIYPGRYSLNVHCTANGQLADWIVDAGSIDVAEGDYFGTGRIAPPGYGHVLVEHHWSVRYS